MDPLIVLKFGGSVLAETGSLDGAVHEIYRWRRAGWRVVAVVSALAGRTEELLARAGSLLPDPAVAGPATERRGRAALVGTGELESAALLGLRLGAAGIPARVLDPGAVGLIAEGDPLEADPVDLDRAAFERALEHGVAVFPGFVAVDRAGGRAVLGRGGSDLTALFLAQRLGAPRCRLLKDVDALYEADPRTAGARPPRAFAEATFADALATDGTILQHKAVRFAEAVGLRFELAGLGAAQGTSVGAERTVFAAGRPPVRRRLSVALLGCGSVGRGVVDLLGSNSFGSHPDRFELVGVAVRDLRRGSRGVRAELLTDDPVGLARSGADVVVELMGGLEPAAEATAAALDSGSHVVTANKRVLAELGCELRSRAERAERRLLCAAAVGGAAPILELARRVKGRGVASVRARLNGTAGYVAAALAGGAELEQALSTARALGLAEEDASRDLDGRDAADKLCAIAAALGEPRLRPEQVRRPGAAELQSAASGKLARAGTGALAQVAELERFGRGWLASVRYASLAPDDPLADFEPNECGASLHFEDGGCAAVRGAGAGRRPTTEAVMGDLLELWRGAQLPAGGAPFAVARSPCATRPS